MQYHHLCTNCMIVSPRARYHSASSFWFSVGILIISERHYRRLEIFSFLTLFRSSELNICLHWVIECRSHLVLVTVIASCEYAMMLIKDFLALIWTAIKIYIYIYIHYLKFKKRWYISYNFTFKKPRSFYYKTIAFNFKP